jgi:hypothetical protein
VAADESALFTLFAAVVPVDVPLFFDALAV